MIFLLYILLELFKCIKIFFIGMTSGGFNYLNALFSVDRLDDFSLGDDFDNCSVGSYGNGENLDVEEWVRFFEDYENLEMFR